MAFRSFIILLMVVSFFPVFTRAESGQVSQFQTEQKSLKRAYDLRKASADRQQKQARPAKVIKRTSEFKDCKGFSCQYSRAQNNVADQFSKNLKGLKDQSKNFFQRWILKAKNFLSGLQYFVKKNVLRAEKFRSNELPIMGEIRFDVSTSGSRPLVHLRSSEMIEDLDGTIEKIVWDFGDGTTMEIPFHEVDDRGEVSHIYADPMHYNVSLTAYDDLNGSTTITGYVEIVNNELPVPRMALDVNSGTAPLQVNFTPQSYDPEDHLSHHELYIIGGPEIHASDVIEPFSHEFTDPGLYELEYVVRDVNNAVARTTFQVFVDEPLPTGGSSPSIVVNSSDIIGLAPHSVQFRAHESFDIDGTVASYDWDFGDYDSIDNFSDEANPSHIYKKPGNYFVRLTVTDNGGRQSTRFLEVYVEATEILEPLITAYQWDEGTSEIFMDGNVLSMRSVGYRRFWDFGDSNTADWDFPSNLYSAPGTYTVTLVEHNITGHRIVVTKDITVGNDNDRPNVQLSTDKDALGVFEEVEFDASESEDPQQNDPLEYYWSFGDGQYLEGGDIETYEYSDRGMYTAAVIVTNSRGISRENNRYLFVVEDARLNPRIQFSPKVAAVPFTANFTSNNTSSEGTTIVKKTWRIFDDDMYVSDGETFSHTFNNPGECWVEFYVQDSIGNVQLAAEPVIAYDSGEVPVGNNPPNATFAYYTDPYDDRSMEFDGTGSSDLDGDRLVYEWKVNGQEFSMGEFAWYRFPYSNIYNVQLTVYDQWGASSVYSEIIDISGSAAQQVVFDYAPLKPVATETIQFSAENVIVPGSVVTGYSWNFGDSSVDTGVNVQHAYSAPGTYNVELTVVDNNSNEFVVEKEIVVHSVASAPNLKLSIKDVDSLVDVTNSQTYRGTSFPETLRLSVLGTTDSFGHIKDAVWNLGNGETAFGTTLEYTYKKPGTYNISVTGYDIHDVSSTASATIVIPNDCRRMEGQNTCFDWVGVNDNILPLSTSQWTLEKSGGFSSDSKHFPKNWITLVALDGSEQVLDIASASSVSGSQIQISRSALVQKNINMKRPYKLLVQTVDNTGAPVFGEWPLLHFGAGRLDISTNEAGVRLQVFIPSAQYRKFIDLQASTSYQLQNLPVGPATVIAEKNGVYTYWNMDIAAHQLSSLSVDMNRRQLAKTRGGGSFNPKDIPVWVQKRNEWATRQDKVVSKGRSSWPVWTMDLCGNEPPFNLSANRVISETHTPDWNFWSGNPHAQDEFRPISYGTSKSVKLSCGIHSESLLYGLYRWKYKEGPSRCDGFKDPHWFWDWYLKRDNYDDQVVRVMYEIQDDWTSYTYRDHLVFSASDLMRRHGRELTQMTQREGLPVMGGDFAYRQEFELEIPPHFQRPQIRFELQSAHNQNNSDLYIVSCDVLTLDNQPKAIRLSPAEFNPTSNLAARNAQLSLQKRFGYLPVQFDSRSGSAHSIDSDASKADYELSIQYYNQHTIDWQGVDVEFEYNGHTHPESYSFTGAGSNDAATSTYKNTFTINTNDLQGVFSWEPGVDRVKLKITPYGEDALNAPVSAQPLELQMVALFDLQTIDGSSPVACSGGYFGSSLSTFAQDLLIRRLVALEQEGHTNRCGSSGLPFGGPMDLTGLEQNTYQQGLSISLRTQNEGMIQDSYDANFGDERWNDVQAYLIYSDAIQTIAQEEDEYDLMSNPTDKKKIYDFCHPISAAPVYPCHETTTFESLNAEMILKICQWNSTTSLDLEGCPTGYMDEIHRFALWVKMNVPSFTLMKNTGLAQPTMSSGAFADTDLYQDVYQKALVQGVWPDGQPIWDPSLVSTTMTQDRITECHKDQKGCEWIKDGFINDPAYLGNLDLFFGWRW